MISTYGITVLGAFPLEILRGRMDNTTLLQGNKVSLRPHDEKKTEAKMAPPLTTGAVSGCVTLGTILAPPKPNY